ncbi:MAG: hypothetical protein LUH40_03880 [Clostridiales bacterium]|nr:hypothetical protein [Clostridiales bacterium]
MSRKFVIIGGDCRFAYMEGILRDMGYNALRIYPGEYTAEDIKTADVIILPVPVSRDKININAPFAKENLPIEDFIKLLPKMNKNVVIAGGLFCGDLERIIKENGTEAFDYYKDEELILKNAVLTAEGVTGIIINSVPSSICGMNFVVTGYGRCGSRICKNIKALGGSVTAAARSGASLLNAEKDGIKGVYIDNLKSICKTADIIINTVPSMILDADILKEINKDCYLIEIASAPFGIDFNAASELGLTVIKASSVPGKTAPKTAGKIITESVLNYLNGEQGVVK